MRLTITRALKLIRRAPGERLHLPTAIVIAMILLSLNACVKRPFIPVNVGKEYGNPKLPLVVSHAREKNQWTLNRVGPHNIFQRALCFKYVCRKMIANSKNLHMISRKEFARVIKRNAKRGFFNTTPSSPVETLPGDTLPTANTVTPTDNRVEPPPAAPILKADSLITLNEFLFETNSYKLRVEHFSQLNSLSHFLQAHPTLEVSISGHTDSTGDERRNVTLSTRRAEAVAKYLVSKGADYDRIIFQGMGSSKPLMGNETAEGRAKNRRVEILIQNSRK